MKHFLLSLVVGICIIVYIEQTPKYQDDIIDTGTVIASGCATGSYKGHINYNCSADIEMSNGEVIRTILTFGVLEGDRIIKMCGIKLTRPEYLCYYRRPFTVDEL